MGYHGYPALPNPSAGGVGNSYALVFVNTDDPGRTPSQAQLQHTAYADCTALGMMGVNCMTGMVATVCGTVGTMGTTLPFATAGGAQALRLRRCCARTSLGQGCTEHRHRLDNTRQAGTQRGQAVLGAWWHHWIDLFVDQALLLQKAQAGRQHLGADACQRGLQLGVSPCLPAGRG